VDYFTLPCESSPVKISSPLSTTFDPFDVSWLLESLFTQDGIENAENLQDNLEKTVLCEGQDIQTVTPGQDTPYHQIVTHGLDILQKAKSGQGTLETWDVFRSMHGGHSFITTKTTARSTQLESSGQLCLPFSTPGELCLDISHYLVLQHFSFIVCSTQAGALAGPGLGEDLLDLMLYEGNLDSVPPVPSDTRESPDPMLELFSMPVKCSSPTHTSLTNPHTDPCPPDSDTLEWLLAQPQLDEIDCRLTDADWLLSPNSPCNSSVVSSVPSPQPDVINGGETSPQPLSPQACSISCTDSCTTLPHQAYLHDHTYAAPDPSLPVDSTSCVEEDVKYVERRRKNNLASQVSRAKRKRKYTDMFSRLDELQEENKRLKKEVSIAEVEAARLKSLIVGKLQCT